MRSCFLLIQIFTGSDVELGIPILAESRDQRALEEFVCTDTQTATESLSRAAYLPAVKIYSRKPIIFLKPHGIKAA